MSDFGPLRTLPESIPRELPRSEPRLRQTTKPGGLLRRPWFIRLLAIGILLAVWQLVAFTNARIPGIQEVVRFFFTELTGGVHAGRSLRGNLWGPLLTSLQRYGIGLLIGLPAGFGLGILIGASRLARGLLNDTTLALLALPSVVWAFLSSLWFGLTSQGPIFAVVLTVTPFVAVSVSSGVRNIDKGLVDMCTSFRVPLLRRTQHLILGGTLPSAITGIRLAFMAGWNSLLIVEWFGSTSGVGYRARFLHDFQEFPGFVSWVLLFILLIMLVDRFLLRPLERRAFRWNERPLLTLEEGDDFQMPEQDTLPQDTLQQGFLEQHAPQQDAPQHAPQQHTFQQNTFQQHTPQHTPQQHTFQQNAPQHHAPPQNTFQQHAPQHHAPQQDTLQHAPQQNTFQQHAPQHTPQDAPQQHTPQHTPQHSLQDAPQQDTLQNAPQPTTPQHAPEDTP